MKKEKIDNNNNTIRKETDNTNFFELLRKNYGWFFALFPAIGFLLLFSNYFNMMVRFKTFGLNFEFISNSGSGIVFKYFVNLMAFFTVIFASFCKYQNKKNKVSKNEKRVNSFIIILSCFFIMILLSFYYIPMYFDINTVIVMIVVNIIYLIINYIMVIFYYLMLKPIFGDLYDLKKSLLKKVLPIIYIFKVIFLSIIGLVIIFFLINRLSISLEKNYYIIGEEQVIVYTSSDYYLTLECVITDDKLIIYRNTQNKISSNNTETKYRTFKDVKIMDENDEKKEDSLDDKTS